MLNTIKENTNDYQTETPDYDGLWKNIKEEKKIMGLEKLRDTPTFGKLYREIEEKATREGMEKGLEKGLEKGIEDTERKFVKNLLDRNYAEEEITELTGLDLEEVRKLRKSLGKE